MNKVQGEGWQLPEISVLSKAQIQLVWFIRIQNQLDYWHSALSLPQLKLSPNSCTLAYKW